MNNAILGLFYFLVPVALYIYTSYCFYVIAKRVNHQSPWFAWVPILNTVQMLQIAKLSLWWILALCIPFLNIIFAIYVIYKYLQVLGKPGWWTILMVLPGFNLVALGLLAFENEAPPSTPTNPPVSSLPPVPPINPTI